MPVEEIIERGYDLTARNPNRKEAFEHRKPEELISSILEKEQRIASIVEEVQGLLGGNNARA